ncbi:hypothetical protein M8J76_015003 [Diaphorina citri]|nr:hypothetical protein M8J75_009972 [Diaphorina citri]KAI5745866.1 hypothetical protein M8J76_015003 [Diaphorina citri]
MSAMEIDQEVLRLWMSRKAIDDMIDENEVENAAPKPPVSPDGEFSGDVFANKEFSGESSEDSGYELEDLEPELEETSIVVNGGDLKDFPAQYYIPAIRKHEFPVVGIYVDPRIVCGFRYKVRPIQDEEFQKEKLLFNGRALELQSIGRGYSRRLTFQPDEGTINDNPNYFWADSRPNGFAFEISVISSGDMFMIQDANHMIIGTLQVVQIQNPQEEITHQVLDDGEVEKTIRVRTFCKVEYFQDNNVGHALVPVSGVAIVSRPRGKSATVLRVTNASIGYPARRGYTLVPGVDNKYRTVTVSGAAIGDAPTTYTVTGLEPFEMPVIGTYVDPRIVPGFEYRVCPAGNRRRHLFNGDALRLVSIGMGYAKRLTFAPSPNCLNNNSNYFWSDSYPDGLGFEPRALHVGMKFNIYAGDQRLGYANVYRADVSQMEEKQELIENLDGIPGTSIVKHIHVDVICQVVLEQVGDGGKQLKIEDIHRMRVAGTAILVKPPRAASAKLLRVENIGLDSLLNLLFLNQQSLLVFYPMDD